MIDLNDAHPQDYWDDWRDDLPGHIDWPDDWSINDAYQADAWPELCDWVRLPDGRVRPVLRRRP